MSNDTPLSIFHNPSALRITDSVQANDPTASPSHTPAAAEIRKEHGTAIRLEGDTVRYMGVTKYVAGSDKVDPNTAGVLATARDAIGPVGAVTAKSVVTILLDGHPFETSAEVAANMGYLRKTTNGYEDTGLGKGTMVTPQSTEVAPVPLSEQATRTRDALANTLPTPIINGIVASIVNGDKVDTRIGPEFGMDAETFGAFVEGMKSELVMQAHAQLHQAGVDADDFFAWMRGSDPRRLQSLMLQQAHSGDARVYLGLVQQYLSSVPPAPAAIAPRYKTWIAPNGTPMVNIDGLITTVDAATKAGLL